MSDFFKTIRGARFYEVHVPSIARSLERIAVSLEKLVTALEEQKVEEAHDDTDRVDGTAVSRA